MGLLFSRKNSHMEKLKAGIFDNPQIRELMKDPMFDKARSKAELFAWKSLMSVVINFLENNWSVEYEKEIEELLKNLHSSGHECQTALSAVTLGLFSKELWRSKWRAGWALSPDIHIMEEHYQGHWDVNFLTGYCWCLKQDAVGAKHRRKSLKSINSFFCVFFSLL